MTTRRSFMSSILAAATPPGFVRAGVLMPVAPLIVLGDGGGRAVLREMAKAQADHMRLPQLEQRAIEQLRDFMARRNASILDQYLTGHHWTGREVEAKFKAHPFVVGLGRA